MRREPKTRHVRVPLTADQYLALDSLATKEDRSLAYVARRAIAIACAKGSVT